MVAVDFGDDERHVRLHAEILGVAEHEFPGLGESHLHFARYDCIERGKDDWGCNHPGIAGNDTTVLN
jgi:hypothetical protein